MKIAISSSGKELKSNVDKVFGRCAYFIFAEIKDKKIVSVEAVENINAQKTGGAGISAAQTVADKKVNVLITGNVGPRALDVLKQFGIEIYNGSGKVKEVLEKFMDGKLETVE